jgi:serine/threonine protein kinase
MSQRIVSSQTSLKLNIVSSANLIQEIYREAESLKKLSHKNIIALYHAFVEGKQLCMIMEYAAGGELYKYVEEK